MHDEVNMAQHSGLRNPLVQADVRRHLAQRRHATVGPVAIRMSAVSVARPAIASRRIATEPIAVPKVR